MTGSGTIEAKLVILAAGAMGTPVILQRSASGLGGVPAAVGRYFSPNGDRVTLGVFDESKVRDLLGLERAPGVPYAAYAIGRPITTASYDYLDASLPEFSRFSLEQIYFPPIVDILAEDGVDGPPVWFGTDKRTLGRGGAGAALLPDRARDAAGLGCLGRRRQGDRREGRARAAPPLEGGRERLQRPPAVDLPHGRRPGHLRARRPARAARPSGHLRDRRLGRPDLALREPLAHHRGARRARLGAPPPARHRARAHAARAGAAARAHRRRTSPALRESRLTGRLFERVLGLDFPSHRG